MRALVMVTLSLLLVLQGCSFTLGTPAAKPPARGSPDLRRLGSPAGVRRGRRTVQCWASARVRGSDDREWRLWTGRLGRAELRDHDPDVVGRRAWCSWVWLCQCDRRAPRRDVPRGISRPRLVCGATCAGTASPRAVRGAHRRCARYWRRDWPRLVDSYHHNVHAPLKGPISLHTSRWIQESFRRRWRRWLRERAADRVLRRLAAGVAPHRRAKPGAMPSIIRSGLRIA